MSIPFDPIDVSGLLIGSTNFLDFKNAGITAAIGQYKNPAHILIHNESGSGMQITMKSSGDSFYLPAGAWSPPTAIVGGETGMYYKIIYVLPNPPVTLLLVTYYGPNEDVPSTAVLGNSPIGIGGTISTNFSTLINTGNPPRTPVITIQPSDSATPTIDVDNSGNVIVYSDNAGVLSTLLQLVAGTSPEVIIAASNILTNVLGALTVNGILTATNSANFVLATQLQDVANVPGFRLGGGSAGDMLDFTTSNSIVKGGPGGAFIFNDQTTNQWQFTAMRHGSSNQAGGSDVVITHGMVVNGVATAPDVVFTQTANSVNTSAPTNVFNITTTQFSLHNGAGVSMIIRWLAVKY